MFLAAPGTDITTLLPGGGSTSVSGTSASSAAVAAAAALLRAIDPSASNGVIVSRLARTADAVGTVAQTGNGRLNLERAAADTETDYVQPVGASPIGSGGPFVGPYSIASATVNTATTLNGSTGVINVAPGASITVVMSVTTTGSGTANDWNLSAWKISNTAPTSSTDATLTCVNTPDNSGADVYTETFTATAPASAGTYNLYLYAYNGGSCPTSGTGASPLFTRAATVVVATPVPTVTNVTSSLANGSYTAGQVVPIQVTFSQAVTVNTAGGIPTLTLTTGSPATTAVPYSSGSGTTALTFNYTVAAGNTSADLAYPLTTSLGLNGGTILNGATAANLTLPTPGNAGSLNANKAIVIDTTAPTVTSIVPAATLTGASSVNFTVTFSESVTGVAAGNFSLTTTGVTGASVGTISGSGTTRTVAVNTGSGDGTIRLDLSSLSPTIADTATNALAATFETGGVVTIDKTIPTVTNVTSSLGDGTYGVGQVVPIQVTFSENVNVTGTPRITLETGATDAVVNYTSGSGTSTLTFNYTVVLGHSSLDLDYISNVALALNGGQIRDAALNNALLTLADPGTAGSLGANKDIVIDAAPPTVTDVTSTAADGAYNASDLPSFPITVTFSKPVIVTGTPTLTLATGTPTTTAVEYTSGSGTNTLTFTYTADATNQTTDLNYAASMVSPGCIASVSQLYGAISNRPTGMPPDSIRRRPSTP